MTNSELRNIVDTFITNKCIPDFYVLVVSCSLTKKQIEYFEKYCKGNQINSVIVWTKSIIEAMLYSDYPDLLFAYFGENVISGKSAIQIKRYDELKEYLERINGTLRIKKLLNKLNIKVKTNLQ